MVTDLARTRHLSRCGVLANMCMVAVACLAATGSTASAFSAASVEIARPVEARTVGRPAIGLVELRATDPGSGEPFEAFTFKRGRERWVGALAASRVAKVDLRTTSCSGASETQRHAGTVLHVRRPLDRSQPVLVYGRVNANVSRLELRARESTRPLPIARSGRAFLAVFSDDYLGTATVLIYRKDGRRETISITVKGVPL